ncbi:MAG: RNA polymerase Rpb4 family protein [Candidatus Micrarchaeota archaeon]
MDVKSSRPVTIHEVKEILARRKEEGELGYEQSQALDNAERFAKVDSEKAAKLAEAISGIGKISKETAIKILDVWPDNPATLRAVLLKDRVELSEEDIAKVLKELA